VTQVWTNPSVLQFAGNADPVEAMTAHARSIVLRAIDAGWAGPPFDPVALAEFLEIPVSPTDVIPDARTVPLGDGVQIEFNPNRPRGRVRYSVAHEIAHTFFADCADQIRNRVRHSSEKGDAWQLEALCNVGAAELVMPIAALSLASDVRPGIEKLLEERQRFDVSTEALFIRVARAAAAPIAMFSASRSSHSRYRLDYVIPSPTWSAVKVRSGLVLPSGTVVAECLNIGFTSAGNEVWGRSDTPVHVECVGIPPYPGALFPRVAGIAWETNQVQSASITAPLIRYVRGDATRPRDDRSLIVHVVNDATPIWGGNGFAAALRRAYPQLQRSFKSWWGSTRGSRLGRVHVTDVADDIWVASIVAQHGYGPSSTPRLRYSALHEGLQHSAAAALAHRLTVHMPRIGSGQAGGRWPVVEELIRDTFARVKRSVTVYDLPLPNGSTIGIAGESSGTLRTAHADSGTDQTRRSTSDVVDEARS
jgi:hypothetical protein